MLNDFISYLKQQVVNHSIYVIGAQGQSNLTEEWIRKRESDPKNADRAVAFWKKQVAAGYGDVLKAFDCSGLGMYWVLDKKLYTSDLNANGMYGVLCDPIKKSELRKGDWVFMDTDGRKHHVGYIVDDELNVIECRGRDYGVCLTKLKDRPWTHWGRPKIFNESLDIVIRRVLKKGMEGDDVYALQDALKTNGIVIEKDGKFGTDTETAVKKFQGKIGLKEDGVAGKNTCEALNLIWANNRTDQEIIIELNQQVIQLKSDLETLSNAKINQENMLENYKKVVENIYNLVKMV